MQIQRLDEGTSCSLEEQFLTGLLSLTHELVKELRMRSSLWKQHPQKEQEQDIEYMEVFSSSDKRKWGSE